MKIKISGVVVCVAMAAVCVPVRANDSAASVGVGGLVLTHEPRISMEKERLTISLAKVTVEYEFLNTSDADIETEVAFPIPAYKNDMGAGGVRTFNDFKLWVEGKPLAYGTEAKAFVEGKDVTAELEKDKLDMVTLGHLTDAGSNGVSKDFMKLSAEEKKRVQAAGLFESADGEFPTWEVRKTYHWTQVFPAHKLLHVKHEYVPAFGYRMIRAEVFDDAARAKLLKADKEHHSGDYDALPGDLDDVKMLTTACVDPGLEKTLYGTVTGLTGKEKQENGGFVETAWVDYIVTTANSWKTPIKDFSLVVEKVRPESWVSLCWDGPVTKVDGLRFEMEAKDFVPVKELHVDFFTVGR